MSIVKVRLASAVDLGATASGVGDLTSPAASRSARDPKGVMGKVVGAELNVTATDGTTPTLDVIIRGNGGTSPAIPFTMITFTQATTSAVTVRKGLDSAWTDIVNPSGANPGAVDVLDNLFVTATLGGTDPVYSFTVDLLVKLPD